MADEQVLQSMYEELNAMQASMHEQNQRRIRTGIRAMFLVPLIFLFLMFISGSSKLIFLVLWIASLFLIATYLLTVEYLDFTMQKKWQAMSGNHAEEISSLVTVRKERWI